MTEIYEIGISGWNALLVILAVTLVTAWRLIAYANSSADSPYVADIELDASSGDADHDAGHH